MKILEIIPSREKDLGGFSVRRVLPEREHTMVGPFIFFDHIGPAVFQPNEGIDVRPHPHINLATVTYLFEGELYHRDSLGSVQLIKPGEINWMIAGRGIVHSERTPEAARDKESKLSGIQCWVALPEEFEDVEPSFSHHDAASLPAFTINGVDFKLLLGSALGYTSPVKMYSKLFYMSVTIPTGKSIHLPQGSEECAVYVVQGKVKINDNEINQYQMGVTHEGESLKIDAVENTHCMILGGEHIGKRYIYWNFVSSKIEKIQQAKADWKFGPGSEATNRFPTIPGDDKEYIPLPHEENPPGTVM